MILMLGEKTLAFINNAFMLSSMALVLLTADQVIDALGGTTKAARRLNQSAGTISNWRARKSIPPEHFLVVTEALAEIGMKADPKVFSFKDPSINAEGDCVELR